MTAQLHAELLKLRTTRTFVALVGSALAISLLVVVLTAVLSDGMSEDEVADLFAADFTGLFVLLLGVVGMAGEWRHRTITSTVLAAPNRVRLVVVKTLAYAIAGIVLSAVVTTVIMVVGSAVLSARGENTAGLGALVDVAWRNLAVSALLGALGAAIGGLLRNQVGAVVGLLVFSFVVEPTVLALAPDVGRFGPTAGAPAGIADAEFIDDDGLLAPGIAALVMLGWVTASAAGAAVLLRRRDLT